MKYVLANYQPMQNQSIVLLLSAGEKYEMQETE